MPENKIYAYFRKFVIILILLFTFVLPLKLGGIVGVPEATGLFTNQLAAYLIITWPIFLFPLFSGVLLVLALIAFPFKSISFAVIISIIASFEGINSQGGAEGVGRATTSSVVRSFILIIVADCFFTALFYFIMR